MNKLIDGIEVPLTETEIAEYLQREQEFIASKFATAKSVALVKINQDDNKIYQDTIGNKQTEYLDAANDARAFKSVNYTGVVPSSIQSWADAKYWTPQQACDDILAQETAWKGAASLIRAVRLKAKEDIKRANTISEIDTLMVSWNSFVNNIRSQLGI